MKEKLLFRDVPFNGELVFARPDRAAYVPRIHSATEESATWGEFREVMPPTDYSTIMECFDECGEPRPDEQGAFDSEQVPGYSDGDYPPWLQQEMINVLPVEILSRFGTRESTFLNGSYWAILNSAREDLCNALEEAGFDLD